MRVSLYLLGVATATAITGIFLAALSCAVGSSLLSPGGMRGIVPLAIDAAAGGLIALAIFVHARSPSAHSEERKKQEAAARLALFGMAAVVLVLLLFPIVFITCASA